MCDLLRSFYGRGREVGCHSRLACVCLWRGVWRGWRAVVYMLLGLLWSVVACVPVSVFSAFSLRHSHFRHLFLPADAGSFMSYSVQLQAVLCLFDTERTHEEQPWSIMCRISHSARRPSTIKWPYFIIVFPNGRHTFGYRFANNKPIYSHHRPSTRYICTVPCIVLNWTGFCIHRPHWA